MVRRPFDIGGVRRAIQHLSDAQLFQFRIGYLALAFLLHHGGEHSPITIIIKGKEENRNGTLELPISIAALLLHSGATNQVDAAE